MVRGKRRQIATLEANKHDDVGDVVESSDSGIKWDLYADDDWVIVKKQKINILVPPIPLPVKKQKINILVPPPLPVKPTTKGPRTNQIKTNSRKTRRVKSNVMDEICSRKGSTAQQKSFVAPTSEDDADTNQVPNHFIRESNLHGSYRPLQPGVEKAFKRPIVPQSACYKKPTLFVRPSVCLNVGVLQNRRMRASNLEKKLDKAGGLSTWLMSQGLGQFARMFQRKNVGKFQLLNLTMAKLKDMGANAVGPRRKLIHAIDCVSQPYCFSAF